MQSGSARFHETDTRFGALYEENNYLRKMKRKLLNLQASRLVQNYDENLSASELCKEIQDQKFLAKNGTPETVPDLLSF